MSAPTYWYDHRPEVAYAQEQAWRGIRDACREALTQRVQPERRDDRVTDALGAYTVASLGRVHTVRSLAALAQVTRRERKAQGVVWPEDGC